MLREQERIKNRISLSLALSPYLSKSQSQIEFYDFTREGIARTTNATGRPTIEWERLIELLKLVKSDDIGKLGPKILSKWHIFDP